MNYPKCFTSAGIYLINILHLNGAQGVTRIQQHKWNWGKVGWANQNLSWSGNSNKIRGESTTSVEHGDIIISLSPLSFKSRVGCVGKVLILIDWALVLSSLQVLNMFRDIFWSMRGDESHWGFSRKWAGIKRWCFSNNIKEKSLRKLEVFFYAIWEK